MTEVTWPIVSAVAYELQHPIIKVPNSPLIIVGTTSHSWLTKEDNPELGDLHSVDIHYDGDDPTHDFVDATAFFPLPDAETLADDYNAPYRKSYRLLVRRMTTWSRTISDVLDKHDRASTFLELAVLVREASPGPIAVTHPSGTCGYVRS